MSEVVLLSGGLDSSTLLAHRLACGNEVALALSVFYGQRHAARELAAAEAVANYYGVQHAVLDLSGWGKLLTGSSLTDPSVAVPHGHYADESMKATVVPNRNATLLMAAVGIAQSRGAVSVLTAVHAGDHPVYPDCRSDFIVAAHDAAVLGTGGVVGVIAPFVNKTKTVIAGLAKELRVPVHLTWSCYEGGTVHCGQCGTCVDRIEALRDSGWADPTVYALVPA